MQFLGKWRVLVWSLAFCAFVSGAVAEQELRSGWFPRAPYQMEAGLRDPGAVTGLDIQIARDLFGDAGYAITFEEMSWSELLQGLRSGAIDFVMGSYHEKDREAYITYSVPYRTERNVIYYRRGLDDLEAVRDIGDLLQILARDALRFAVMEGYVYGSQELTEFLEEPPAAVHLVSSSSYRESLSLVIKGRADLFVANPLVMDRMLVKADQWDYVRKIRVDMGEIPVHVMFNKETIPKEQRDRFDEILQAMLEDGRIRAHHRSFVLPVYLSITTGQFWFVLLNLMGIVAFCTSGVLLARKERYNLFGALILAILPAIGGGVLRDLFLGADRVFVLETPEYMLVAIGVVVIAFLAFKGYDFLHGSSREVTRKIERYTEEKFGGLFDQLFKFFDAWAVAAFTVIGVSVAVEMDSSPLWLWGPAMGVLTASGGVVLRDIVRADFNIEMLKQDSYAEVSLLGGIVYTVALIDLPYDMNLERIFYLTMIVIALLFGVRFLILWKGYTNPLQFGALHTHPEIRLRQFVQREPEWWALLTRYYTEDDEGKAVPAAHTEREALHNQFLYTGNAAREHLDGIAAEPLAEATVQFYRNCSARLDIATALEETLFSFIDLHEGLDTAGSGGGAELQVRIHESLKTLIETARWAIDADDLADFTMLEHLTAEHQRRFNELRAKYRTGQDGNEDSCLEAVLQSTHKVERIIYLLSDYVRIRLGKRDTRAGSASNRRAQQAHLLGM